MNFYYVLNLFLGVIESICYGGLLAGWPAIEYMFKSDGRFGYLCDVTHDVIIGNNSSSNATGNVTQKAVIGCDEQSSMMGLVFITSMTSMFVLSYPNGWLFDKYGTWVSRAAGQVLFNVGCCFISETTAEQSWALIPGMVMISVGGMAFAVAPNSQVGNLFGEWRASVVTLLVGCFQGATLMAVILKMFFEAGYSCQTIFRFLNYLSIFVWFRTFALMPKDKIPFPLPEGGYVCELEKLINRCLTSKKSKASEETKEDENEGGDLLPKENGSNPAPTSVEEKEIHTFWEYIKTPMFFWEFITYFILHFRNVFYISSLMAMLGTMYGMDIEKQGEVVNQFVLIQALTMVMAPFTGMSIQKISAYFTTKGDSPVGAAGKSIFLLKGFVSLMATLFSVTVIVPVFAVQYLSFVLLLIYRSFIYGLVFTFLVMLFPKEHYGKLLGILHAALGILQLIQTPILTFVLTNLEGDFSIVNYVFLALCGLTLLHPIYFYRKYSKMQSPAAASEEKRDLAEDSV